MRARTIASGAAALLLAIAAQAQDTAGDTRSQEIAAAVEAQLSNDRMVDLDSIDVMLTDGRSAEKSHASRLAWIAGTESVDVNGLQVASNGAAPRPTNRTLR